MPDLVKKVWQNHANDTNASNSSLTYNFLVKMQQNLFFSGFVAFSFLFTVYHLYHLPDSKEQQKTHDVTLSKIHSR